MESSTSIAFTTGSACTLTLVIKDGTVRMVNVTPPANNTVDRVIELVPQVLDRVDAFIEKQQKSK